MCTADSFLSEYFQSMASWSANAEPMDIEGWLYNAVLLTVVTVLFMRSSEVTDPACGKLCTFEQIYQFPQAPATGNPHSPPFFHESDFLTSHL